jgi:hypothetical protein
MTTLRRSTLQQLVDQARAVVEAIGDDSASGLLSRETIRRSDELRRTLHLTNRELNQNEQIQQR